MTFKNTLATEVLTPEVAERTRPYTDGDPAVHIVIPDTQAKAGVPTIHLQWIGQYIVDHFAGRPNVKVIHLGDHADMPSLSSYDKGKRAMEGRRYTIDIAAANHAFDVLNQPLVEYNKKRRKHKEAQWWPERHITLGNHENRIARAAEDDAQLDGLVRLDDLNYEAHGWTVHEFLKPIDIDGVAYAHYWVNPMSGRPMSAMAVTRLKQVGRSFAMGHQQTLDYALRFVDGKSQHALIAGACYLHEEEFLGPQGNAHWRGIVVCHDVENGSYNPMFLDLDYLCRRYEGVRLREFVARSL